MKIRIELGEKQLIELAKSHIQEQLGSVDLDDCVIELQTKSAQNYKAEWERAEFRLVVSRS
jgi:hypothetical protein